MATDFKPGDIIANKFRVERELGEGGMAYVLEVTHLHLEERAAIKLLRQEVLHHGSVVERFSREARAMIKLKSEHVARVLDVGAFPDGSPYMVMEFLEGVDLAEHLEARGPFAYQDAVDLVLQVCDAIAEAHARGIVHRDIKPANLFLVSRPDGSPSIKVLDFGISKIAAGAMAEGSLSLTRTSALLGSPLYMAPEQIASARDANARTDMWGLGVVLYELLSGHPPFEAETLSRLQHQILREPPTPLPTGSIPAELAAVVMRCLAKDPDARFDNMASLAEALAPFTSKRGAPYVDRVRGIVSRAGTLATTTGNRTERLRSISNRTNLQGSVTPHGETEAAEPQRPTVTMPQKTDDRAKAAAASSGNAEHRLGEGTQDAWGGTNPRTNRSRIGIAIAAVLGTLATVVLVIAGVRFVSSDQTAPADSARVAAATPTDRETVALTTPPERGIVEPPAPEAPAAASSALPARTAAPPAASAAPNTVRPNTQPAKTAKTTPPASDAKRGGNLFDTRK